MKLYRLDSKNGTINGILFVLPSGKRRIAEWRTNSVQSSLETAKEIAANLRYDLMQSNAQDDIDRTNWPSVVAAVQRHVDDSRPKPQLLNLT